MSQTQLTYVMVQTGDTLESIAKRYKTTVATIARLNGLAREATLSAGQLMQVPKPPPEPVVKSNTPRPRVPRYAFAVHTGQEGVYPGSDKALAREGAESLSGIYPLWFQVSPSEPWKLQSFATESQIQNTVQQAKERQVKVIATLSNLYYNGVVSGKEVAHQAMTLYRDALFESLVTTYQHYGLDGIQLDWVDIYEADRETFAEWIVRLGDVCKSNGLLLVVNVPMTAGMQRGPDAGLFPLRPIGKVADFVALLLNSEHRMYTGPGPLSSLSWTEAGIQNAIQHGVAPQKILLGIAGYAYDWKASSQVPEYLSYEGAMNRARQYRANVQFDTKSQTPMFRYTDASGGEHQVWFENSSSLSQKITLVNRYELAGITLWRLGIEDPGLWALLRYRWGSVKKWKDGNSNST
ncbi:MAG: LysM peptidoglycan-binding domain-containing protein [Tumebacillaceae bacterium]